MTISNTVLQNIASIPHPAANEKRYSSYRSIIQSVYIEPGTLKDYEYLSHYHYRTAKLGPIAGIWVIRSRGYFRHIESKPVAVIVYTWPAPNLAVRNLVTRKFFCKRNKSEGLKLLNSHVRCISRVIVDPQWRGFGLAGWLVKNTMPLLDVPMIESMALMGCFHPFLAKAGLRPFLPPADKTTQKLIATLESLNIGSEVWHNPDLVQTKMDCLFEKEATLLDRRIHAFLGRFGKRRKMMWGIERTTFVLQRLSNQWMYYAWLNPKRKVAGLKLSHAEIAEVA